MSTRQLAQQREGFSMSQLLVDIKQAVQDGKYNDYYANDLSGMITQLKRQGYNTSPQYDTAHPEACIRAPAFHVWDEDETYRRNYIVYMIDGMFTICPVDLDRAEDKYNVEKTE